MAAPAAASNAPAKAAGSCPSFRADHNDHIGKVSFPRGPYKMVVSEISCASSTKYMQTFLERPSGNLPKPWKLALLSGGRRRFTKVGTKIDIQATPIPERTLSAGNLACLGYFHVLHNDHIGAMKFPAGRYSFIMLSHNEMTCATASHDFAYFLQSDWAGNLPSPWRMNAKTRTFYQGPGSTNGFRVVPYPARR